MLLKKILLILFSFFFGICIIEIALIKKKTYINQVHSKLVPSDALFERPKNSIYKNLHPDTGEIISIKYDNEGIRNFDSLNTYQKKNIIAFFGDSHTENINIKNKMTFIDLLQKNYTDYNFVNYGVGNYSLDQIIIRYNKFKSHNIQKVFYVFCSNDLDHLERGLIKIERNQLVVNKIESPKIVRLIGKFHITYLMIDSFYSLRALLYDNFTKIDKENYPSFLASKYLRTVKNFDGYNYTKNRKLFIKFINYFNEAAHNDNREFYIIILPLKSEDRAFKNIFNLDTKKFNIINLYEISGHDEEFEKKIRFKNDGHFNENGQKYIAELLKKFIF